MKAINNIAGESLMENSQQYISEKDKKRFSRDILSSVAALVFLASGLIYKKLFPEQDVIISLIFFLGVIIVGTPVIITAAKGLIKKDLSASMEMLVSVAIIVSTLDGQYMVAILIPVILTAVHFLEEKSIMGSREAIDGLKKMQSDTAIRLDGDIETKVDARSLVCGDIIIVKPGEALPIDGVIISGSSNMDQKSLTGESLPKEVNQGDTVFAGTININGLITVRVEKGYKDTSFQRIVELLENAENITLPEAKIVDKFMLYYIPITLIIATLTWVFTKDITKAIAILVVSCPCGYMLVSSAPMIAALAAATKRGILIKRPSFIEKLTDVECFVFDKTGTITNGTLEAVECIVVGAADKNELLSTAAAVAHGSLHPTSKSIINMCRNIDFDMSFQVSEIIGQGMRGTNGKDTIILGNYRYITSLGYTVTDEYEAVGRTSWIVKNDVIFGCIVFRDILRDDVGSVFEKLRNLGIKRIDVLTGDNATEAKRISEEIDIDSMYYELMPEQKLEKIRENKNSGLVAFVGDGINDSLALSEADVGIAMGAMGSDTAIQSADISLMNNSLDNLPYIVMLARKTKEIIYQNIVIAFAISVVMIFLAACGFISPIVGAFLHNIGAFIVIINSGRVIKTEKE